MFTYERKIFGFECDIYGHLNNSGYLHIYEEARSIAFEALGFSIKQFRENSISVFIKKIEIDYSSELKLEETATIVTEIEFISRVKITWRQKIFNPEGELLNSCVTETIFVKNSRPVRIDNNLHSKFLENIEATNGVQNE